MLAPNRAVAEERWLASALAVTCVKRRLAAQLISRADQRRDPLLFEAQRLTHSLSALFGERSRRCERRLSGSRSPKWAILLRQPQGRVVAARFDVKRYYSLA